MNRLRAPSGPLGRVLLLGALAVPIVVAIVVVVLLRAPSSEPQIHTYVVPAGTGAAEDAGETVDILPGELWLQVGDHLVVRNEDDRLHQVGPFSVRAGETLDHAFNQAGVFTGLCTLHGSGEIRIVVD